ncbi:hypothetical protein ICN84_03675 [Akkermansia glycaniphila]|uniref:tetratricopeptide repeat protein n=1 Tax=Akkermansia glycaniphila TaxID=1679444 RepID=UPI001C034E71|nr:hypothetical protein [Akkermansia glycaniphila]MBT9449172.1 hypothetical protein [Akkermansia glycaniphila]
MLRLSSIRPVILAVSCMAVAACNTTLTLAEPITAIIDVRRNDTLTLTANSDLDRRIAHQVYQKLGPSRFYRIRISHQASGSDIRLALSSSYIHRKINYSTTHNHLCDEDHDRDNRTISSYDIRSGVTGSFSSRRTGSFTVRNYYADDRSAVSSTAGRQYVIDKLAEQIVRDLLPSQRTHTVSIAPDHGNAALEQAAEACKTGNWTLGEQLAKQASANKPQSAEPWFLLGIIERNKGNLERSSELIAKSIALRPDDKYRDELQRNVDMKPSTRSNQTR